MARASVKKWMLYIDESGNFAKSDDDVVVAGLLVSDELPGLALNEVKRALEAVVPGFPWPWHAGLINSASWVAIVLSDGRIPANHADSDIRWLADAVRLVNERFEERHASAYQAIQRRVSSGDAGDIKLAELTDFDHVLRTECQAELEALSAHSQRARVAVKDFARGLARRAQRNSEASLAMLVCSSETSRADAVGSPDSELGDRRYFKLLEVLVDRCANVLARRGGLHELALDLSERKLIDPVLKRKAKMNLLYVTREMSAVIAKWRGSVKIVPVAVTPFDSHVGMRFVVADFAANRSRRALRQLPTPLVTVEGELTNDLGLTTRTGTPTRSHLAASGEAYTITTKPLEPSVAPQTLLPIGWPRRRWACEQAWEWCQSDGQ